MPRNRFKPTLREMEAQSLAAQKFYALASPDRERAEAAIVALEAAQLPPPKQRAVPRQLEAPVITAISELLARHPRVIWAARFNSGAASYDAGTGRYAPVWFHRFLRAPEKMRMPDFFGLMASGMPLAIEAKAPGWKKPRDDREREQAAFLNMVTDAGGIALFATSADQVAHALR